MGRERFIRAYRDHARKYTDGVYDEDSLERDANDEDILELFRENKAIYKPGYEEFEGRKKEIMHDKQDKLIDLIIEAEKNKKRRSGK